MFFFLNLVIFVDLFCGRDFSLHLFGAPFLLGGGMGASQWLVAALVGLNQTMTPKLSGKTFSDISSSQQ